MEETKRPSMGFYFSPEAKAFHIVVKLKNVPGALGSVLGLLAGVVNLVEIIAYTLEDGTAIYSGFGKSLSENETEVTLKRLLEGSSMVVECEVKESDNGLIVDSFHTGIEVAPGRAAMIFPADGFSRTCDHLVKLLGSGGRNTAVRRGVCARPIDRPISERETRSGIPRL